LTNNGRLPLIGGQALLKHIYQFVRGINMFCWNGKASKTYTYWTELLIFYVMC